MILENNYFKYNSLIYLQKIGIAMGCICGPSLANLYLYIIEIKWLYIHRPIFYGRFIDDIAFMDLTDLDLEDFKSIFGNSELNITSGDTVIFLDLIIQFNDSTKQLKFSLYNKPSNNFGYLLTNSNHPEHIFDNIIKSLFIRIRRVCTDYSDFVIASIKLAKQLLQRNYKIDKIFNAFRLVSNMDRSLLIPYKNKKDIQTENDILFFTHFNYNLDLKNLIQKSFLNTKKEKSFLSDCNIKIINMINTNINRLFVHNFNIITYKANHTFYCDDCNCFCCDLIYRKSSIFIKDLNFYLPLLDNGDCNSKNLIYIIICLRCNVFYIGETSRPLKRRIYEHLNKITKFKPFTKNITEVSIHFNLKYHNINDFKFCIYKTGLIDSVFRKSAEMDLVNFLNIHKKRCINVVRSFNIKKLVFT